MLETLSSVIAERFRTITSSYYRGASGIFAVASYDSADSVNNIKRLWLNEIERYAKEGVKKAIVLNKTDLAETDRRVSSDDRDALREFGEKANCQFFETSAKTNSVRRGIIICQ